MPFFAQHTRTALLACVAFTAVAAVAAPAWAAPAEVAIYYDLKPQSLETALHTVAERSGRAILAPTALLAGKQAPALHGRFTALEAYKALLVGSGLQITLVGDTVIVHAPDAAAAAAPVNEGAVAEIVVTGSHIRGEASAAPTDIITSKEIDESGYSQIGDVIRSLPETFGGGQNPGVLGGAGVANIGNQNTTNASTVNLRGLGSDATLVLLNGHRLAPDGGFEGVDISVIPIDAIQRIEIVTDGASALYGSDAVAGVANFILRKDYQGLELSERVGAATQGGGLEQTYNLLGGQTWSTGHILAGVQYTHQDQISAGQRAFTANAPPIDALIQAQTNTSYFVNSEQVLTPWATFHMDGLFAKRETGDLQYTAYGPPYISSIHTQSYLAAPSLNFTLPGDWSATLDGSVSATNDYELDQEAGAQGFQKYQNGADSAELSATGTALKLPSGLLKVAVGGGYLGENFKFSDDYGDDWAASRKVIYAFGEASIPLAAPSPTRLGLNALDLTLAGRIEHYSDFGSTANPKVGLRYVPVSGITLRATWGTSFKAPEFIQQAESRAIYQYDAAEVGSNASGIALLAYGGNRNLKPERANSWTVGSDWSPPQLHGLTTSVTYFHIDYRDRIVQPVDDIQAAVSDPIYAPFVTLNPTPATQATALGSASAVYNFSSSAYNPAQVVALIEDHYLNATAQEIQGVDISLKQSLPLAIGKLDALANVSWLEIVQQTLPGSAPLTLTGTLFNPPNLRARVGATWTLGSFAATGFVNYISGETDTGVVPYASVPSWTTADLNLAYRFERPGARWSGLEAALSISNLFDQDPPIARGASALIPGINFDSTNASAVGRFVALTLRERF